MARPALKDERRAQILDALYRVIGERGLAGASVTEIAEHAGVARGALHYFFSSKEEVSLSLMRRLGDEYIAGLHAHLDRKLASGDEAARARLVHGLVMWHFRGDDAVVLQRLTVWIDFWGQAASQQGIQSVVLDVQERARQVCLRALLAQRPELRELARDATLLDANATLRDANLRGHATALLALIEGGLLQWRLSTMGPDSTSAPVAAPLDRARVGQSIADAAHAFALSLSPLSPTAGGLS